MTTPADSPRARLLELLAERIRGETPMPWEDRDRRLAGVPRSGASGRWYSGNTPWLLWAEAAEHGWEAGVWHTANSVDATVDGEGVRMGRSHLYSADRLGLLWPRTSPNAEAASARIDDLASFLGCTIRSGDTPHYDVATGVLRIADADAFEHPGDRAATLAELLVRWTRDEQRLDRDDDTLEPLIAALGGALLSAALRVPGLSIIQTDWTSAVDASGAQLFAAIPQAERAVQYLFDLAHPELRAEQAALDDLGEAERSTHAGKRLASISNLGDALLVDVSDLSDDEEDDDSERNESLFLTQPAGSALFEFLSHFAHDEPGGRKNPPLSAWLGGGPGTGRNQLMAALNALFRTGGTDLGGTLVASEGDADLLAVIEQVWSDERLMVLPATLPSRTRVRHDRAVPTACLTAFHMRYGLSPHLWVARLEHRLLRSGAYKEFVESFETNTGKRWRGEAHRNPVANREAIITALGGAAAGARRRLTHYERTRRTASWEALRDEAEWSLYHLRPGELEPHKKPVAHAAERRALFVMDLSSALRSDDPAARGWVRRAFAAIPTRMREAARPAYRPFWFLMSPDIPLKELADLVGWDTKTRRKQVTVDLDSNPVTAAVGTDLLSKHPSACTPLFEIYANHRDDLHEMVELDGFPLPRMADRDQLLEPFPFLPCVIPVAQAILDTFAGEREALPLKTLVRKALDEQYYAPPDRFVPLDVLLEPMMSLLDHSSTAAAPAGARIFVGNQPKGPTLSLRRLAFPHETVLQTVRWANRIRGFPCKPANLVPLMLTRMERSREFLESEVSETLEELVSRGCLRQVSTPQCHQWVRGL